VITGILGVKQLPVQNTFWRFLNSLGLHNVRQWEQIHAVLLRRVWQAAGLRPHTITIDTDTTVNTVRRDQRLGTMRNRERPWMR
jgi:hypothetical protein